MGGEDGEAGVLERDQRHQDVVGRPAGADLALVGEGGLVAVVAVGDQQLAGRELGGDRLVDGRVADAPDAVGGPVGVGDLAPRLSADRRLQVLPGVARVEGEDGGEVVASRAGEAQPVLLRPGLSALVRPDPLTVGRPA